MSYSDCRLRIQRADMHFEVSTKLWERFVEGETHDITVDIEADGTGTINITPRYDPLPPHFAIEFGEMLYQLRAALDSLVYQAATYDSGESPPPDAEKLEFPFRHSKRKFDEASWKIAPLSSAHRDIIESVQPYNAPSVGDDERAIINSLATINHWARIDRHRRLQVIGGWATQAQPKFRLPNGVTVKSINVAPGTGHFLEDDTKVASFVLDGWEPHLHLEANPDLFIEIAVSESGPLGTNPRLEEVSNAFMTAIQAMLKRFGSS